MKGDRKLSSLQPRVVLERWKPPSSSTPASGNKLKLNPLVKLTRLDSTQIRRLQRLEIPSASNSLSTNQKPTCVSPPANSKSGVGLEPALSPSPATNETPTPTEGRPLEFPVCANTTNSTLNSGPFVRPKLEPSSWTPPNTNESSISVEPSSLLPSGASKLSTDFFWPWLVTDPAANQLSNGSEPSPPLASAVTKFEMGSCCPSSLPPAPGSSKFHMGTSWPPSPATSDWSMGQDPSWLLDPPTKKLKMALDSSGSLGAASLDHSYHIQAEAMARMDAEYQHGYDAGHAEGLAGNADAVIGTPCTVAFATGFTAGIDAALKEKGSEVDLLPQGLLMEVFSYLGERDLMAARAVCSKWREAATNRTAQCGYLMQLAVPLQGCILVGVWQHCLARPALCAGTRSAPLTCGPASDGSLDESHRPCDAHPPRPHQCCCHRNSATIGGAVRGCPANAAAWTSPSMVAVTPRLSERYWSSAGNSRDPRVRGAPPPPTTFWPSDVGPPTVHRYPLARRSTVCPIPLQAVDDTEAFYESFEWRLNGQVLEPSKK